MDNYFAENSQTVASGTTIGIIGLPELAAALQRSGLKVVTGEDFHRAAIAIRDEISGIGKSFPVLISNEKAPTKRAWANRISGDAPLFMLDTDTTDPIVCEGATSIPTPITAGELLTAIGYPEISGNAQGLTINVDGSVSGTVAGGNHVIEAAPEEFTEDFDAELAALLDGDIDDEQNADNSQLTLPVVSEEDDYSNTGNEDDVNYQYEEIEAPENTNSFVQDHEVVRSMEAPSHLNDMNSYNSFSRDDDPWGDDDEDVVVEVPPTPAQPTRPREQAVNTMSESGSVTPRRQRPDFSVATQYEEPVVPEPKRQREPEVPSPRRQRPTDSFPLEAPSFLHEASFEAPQRRRERVTEPSSITPFDDAPSTTTIDDEDDELFIPAAILSGTKAEPELPVRRTHSVPEPEVQLHSMQAAEDLYGTDNQYDYEPAEEVSFEPEYSYVAPKQISEFVPIVGDTPLLFCWGSKGGVGKTTVAMATAQRAAKAGLRVMLIDANRGQGDVRTYLRLSSKDMSSVLDVALGHPIREALHGPKAIAVQRNAPKINPVTRKPEAPKVQPNDIRFGVVLAPKARTADPSLVTGAVYNKVINAVRKAVDLVIVDTQTIEVFDTSGLVDSTILHGLVNGGWSLAVTDLNVTGTANLKDQLEHFSKAGVPKERTFTLINRANDINSPNCATVGKLLGMFSTHLGAVAVDETITDSMNLGQVPELDESATALIDAALYEITGNQKFAPTSKAENTATPRGGLFRKGRQ